MTTAWNRLMRAAIVAATLAAGCADDGDGGGEGASCGDGTLEQNGACIPAPACGAGTRLDPGTDSCVPGDDVCSPGSFLVGDHCERVDTGLEPDAVVAEPDLLVLQWDGWLAASPTRLVQFQARLHSSGVIDFVYGPRHMGDGASATVGAENIEVTSAAQVAFDQRGAVRPESSISLSPVE